MTTEVCPHKNGVKRLRPYSDVPACVDCGAAPPCPECAAALFIKESPWTEPYLACTSTTCANRHGIPRGVVFMGGQPVLEDGEYWSGVRCLCRAKANLRAIVRNGKVAEAGCPVCAHPWVYEIARASGGTKAWQIDFLPPGVVVI